VIQASGKTFGIVGALAAFPRRLAAREVERQNGHLRSSITRRTTHVVFGRKLLARSGNAEIEARLDRERKAGRQLLSENGFLRMLGLRQCPEASAMTRVSLLDQARLAERDFELLSLFDAFEHDREPYSFRDLILSKKYAGLIAGGANWGAIIRSIHRSSGAVGSLTALSLEAEGDNAIYARVGEQLSDLDGQMLLPIAAGSSDAELDALFEQAEEAEAQECFDEAASLYERCLSIDPKDPDAAFNLANCLVVAGRPDQASRSFLVALKLDPGFVEAWFNLANLLKTQGQADAARKHLAKAIAIDGAYADAIYNLATLEFEAGRLAEARRLWARYLELDADSEWARNAAKGIHYADLQLAQRDTG
jgi:tetratricopeptide (TPR) repeat protein